MKYIYSLFVLVAIMAIELNAQAQIVMDGPEIYDYSMKVDRITNVDGGIAGSAIVHGHYLSGNVDEYLNGNEENLTNGIIFLLEHNNSLQCINNAREALLTNGTFYLKAANTLNPLINQSNHVAQVNNFYFYLRLWDLNPQSFDCGYSRSDASSERRQMIRLSINHKQLQTWNENLNTRIPGWNDRFIFTINANYFRLAPAKVTISASTEEEIEHLQECVDLIENNPNRAIDFSYQDNRNVYRGIDNFDRSPIVNIIKGTDYHCELATNSFIRR